MVLTDSETSAPIPSPNRAYLSLVPFFISCGIPFAAPTWNQSDSVFAAKLGRLEDVRAHAGRVCYIIPLATALLMPRWVVVRRTARGDRRLCGGKGIAAEGLREQSGQSALLSR